ncbi:MULTISPECIES: hypothetical protein [Silvimonas]|uniref:hypothetical protein n=1 Tax=Silvimonas TaxID=300264 RepID=UPI0024B325C8|nr:MULTISPECIES: hypothetical protein [Silvimonas]MDR3429636.1 hypothetical protein [Silvimonas sp.]
MNESLYVLQYSVESQNFHVEKLYVMLDKNVRAFTSGIKVGYVPLGMFENLDDLLEAKARLMKSRPKKLA